MIKFYQPILDSETIVRIIRFYGHHTEPLLGNVTPTFSLDLYNFINNEMNDSLLPFVDADIFRVRCLLSFNVDSFDADISGFFDSFPPRYKFGQVTFGKLDSTQVLYNFTYLQNSFPPQSLWVGDVSRGRSFPDSLPASPTAANILSFSNDSVNSVYEDYIDYVRINLRSDVGGILSLQYSAYVIADSIVPPGGLQKEFLIP
jgi:hypothetical protein